MRALALVLALVFSAPALAQEAATWNTYDYPYDLRYSSRVVGIVYPTGPAANSPNWLNAFMPTLSSDGVISLDNSDPTTPWLVHTTAASTNSEGGHLATPSGGGARMGIAPVVTAYIRTGASIASMRIVHGFFGVLDLSTDAAVTDAAYLRYSTAASDTTWKACTANGTTLSCTDTGVTVSTSTAYTLRVDCRTDGTVNFYINGLLRVAKSTHVSPASDTTNLAPVGIWIRTLEAVAKTISMRRWVYDRNW